MKHLFITTLTLSLALLSFAQCPVSSPQNDTSDTDGGSPGCDAGSYKYEGNVSSSSAGACMRFAGTTCGIAWYADSYSLDCPFCVSFTFNLSTFTSDGIALSFVDFSNNNFPCSTPIGCDEGGNLGYNRINTGNANIDGSLTIEFDVFDNGADGDDDPSCDHISIVQNGNNNTSEAQACSSMNMDDGNDHTANICWDPSTNELTVYVDGVAQVTLSTDIRNYFNNNDIHFGFSSGYNGSFLGENNICDWTVTAGTPTGVEPNSFKGKVENNKVQLSWIEAKDFVTKYEVQKSNDGDNYAYLTTVEAGEDNTKYLVYDENPIIGANYYRIKQVEYTGVESFVNPIVVNYAKGTFNINKVNQTLYISPTSKGSYQTTILDASGKTLYQDTCEGFKEINLSGFNNGIYFLNITSSQETKSEKLFIWNE